MPPIANVVNVCCWPTSRTAPFTVGAAGAPRVLLIVRADEDVCSVLAPESDTFAYMVHVPNTVLDPLVDNEYGVPRNVNVTPVPVMELTLMFRLLLAPSAPVDVMVADKPDEDGAFITQFAEYGPRPPLTTVLPKLDCPTSTDELLHEYGLGEVVSCACGTCAKTRNAASRAAIAQILPFMPTLV